MYYLYSEDFTYGNHIQGIMRDEHKTRLQKAVT